MKLVAFSRSRLTRCLIAIPILAVVAAVGPGALAEVRYSVTDLGTLGGWWSYAYNVNNHGEVVGLAGSSTSYNQPFLRSGGGMCDLGALDGSSGSASGINNAGQVVGYENDGQAFLYSGGTMTLLDVFGYYPSYAWAINDNGQIAGEAYTSNGYPHAFLYSGGSASDLGSLGVTNSGAYGINNRGQVVGYSYTNDLCHAFRYSGGSMTDLGTLGGPESTAFSVNDRGQVAGWAQTSSGSTHAFLVTGGQMTDLGALDTPGSVARGLNNQGQVVGWIEPQCDCSYRAFLYSGGRMTDLNDLIDASSGWTLVEACAINDRGQIVGYGRSPTLWEDAFLLTPIRTLFIERAGDGLAISWFTNAPVTLSLFQNTNLAAGSWAPVTNVPVVANDQYQVLISPAPNGSRFYRLQSR